MVRNGGAVEESIDTGDAGDAGSSGRHVGAGELLALWYEMKRLLDRKEPAGPAELERLRALDHEQRTAFEASNGVILKENYGDHMRAGLYYTERQKLVIVKFESFPKEAIPLETLLYDIDRTVDELAHLEDLPTRVALGARLGSLATGVFEEIDLVAKAVKNAPKAAEDRAKRASVAVKQHVLPRERIALLRKEFSHIRAMHDVAVIRQTKLRYLEGLFLGVAVALVFCFCLALLALWFPVDGLDNVPVSAVAAGAVGAAISVMMRMGKPDAKWLDVTAGRGMIRRLGLFRPIIGGVLGAFFVFAVRGGLLPLAVPEGASPAAFFVTVAFLTGFSERLAKNLLSSAERTASGEKEKDEEKEAPAAPAAPTASP